MGGATLITAIVLAVLLLFTGCKPTTSSNTPTPSTPKFTVTFGVEGTPANGTLKAKVDGVPETTTSPITVEKGKTVTFTAKADTDYVIKDMEGFAGLFYRRRTSRQPHCQGNCYRRCDGECNFC